MANLTSVGITAGVPTSGTGTVSTIDNLANIPLKAQIIDTDTGTHSDFLSTFPTAGTAIGGMDENGDFAAFNTAPGFVSGLEELLVADKTSVALLGNVTTILSTNNAILQQLAALLAGGSKKFLPPSSTDTGGSTTGTPLSSLIIIPSTTSPGAVTIQDGTDPAITIFVGGSLSVSTLTPFSIPMGIISQMGQWTFTTGANVSLIATGLL